MDFSPYLGLARNPSDCEADLPEGTINDVSGKTLVYLDDVPEMPLHRLKGRGIWEARANARLLASNTLNTDLKAFLGSSFSARPLYSGFLGKDSVTQYVSPPSQTITMPYYMRYLNGGFLLVRSVGLNLSSAVTNQVVGLYLVGSNEPIKTVSIPSVPARSFAQFSVGETWRIPMDGNRYELRTTLPDGVKIADNPLACGGCGGMGALHAMITNCCSGKASGFRVSLGGDCNYDPLLIQLMENDRTKLVLAYMLAYQACYMLCVASPSGSVERATVLSETDMKDASAQCQQGYLNRLNWLKIEVPKLGLSTDNTCFQAIMPYGWNRSGAFR